MNSHYHFMKTLTNERIQARFKEAEMQRLAQAATENKVRRPAFGRIRNLLTTITTFIRNHPTPVVHWEVGRLHR